MPRRTHSPAQDELQPMLPLFYTPPVVTTLPDGAVMVRPGKPLARMSVSQFAAAVGVHRNTVYPRIGGPELPPEFVEHTGPRLIRIHAAAVDHWKRYWSERRSA
jgi:predicted DNA-binding transcriptional regulator AlpA